MARNLPPQVGESIVFESRHNEGVMVTAIVAECATGPITGKPLYRVVDLPSEMADFNAGQWVKDCQVRYIEGEKYSRV